MGSVFNTEVSDSVARPVRGGVQGGAAFLVVEAIEAFEIFDFTERQFGVTILVLSLVFSFIQNVLENKGLIAAFLKRAPQPPQPVIDPMPEGGA